MEDTGMDSGPAMTDEELLAVLTEFQTTAASYVVAAE